MLTVKTYIGYLDSKQIYFDEENEVFQYNDQKNTSNWIMIILMAPNSIITQMKSMITTKIRRCEG